MTLHIAGLAIIGGAAAVVPPAAAFTVETLPLTSVNLSPPRQRRRSPRCSPTRTDSPTASSGSPARSRLRAAMGMIPAGSFANRSFCAGAVAVDAAVDPLLADLLADAQTSGGLLIAVAAERAEALHAALDRRGVPHPEIGFAAGTGQGHITLR